MIAKLRRAQLTIGTFVADLPWRLLATKLLLAVTALGLLTPAEAVFTNLGIPFVHTVSIRVGSLTAIDTVDFGSIPGSAVGNGAAVSAPGTVDVIVNAATLIPGSKTVTVNADSSAGMSCQSATCTGIIIPFSAVSWTTGGTSTTPTSGSPSAFDIQAGSFTGSASQTIASFPSGRLMSNTLTFKYANATAYPAGSYKGRVTFTASMP